MRWANDVRQDTLLMKEDVNYAIWCHSVPLDIYVIRERTQLLISLLPNENIC